MAVTRLRFKGTNNGTYYLDLASALSQHVRSLHRQKKIYTTFGGFFVDSQAQRLNVNVIPLTWPVKAAINRGFRSWKKMNKLALSSSEVSTKKTYSDFKVYMSRQHRGGTTLQPLDANDHELYNNTPEWDYAQLRTGDPYEDPVSGVTQAPDWFGLHVVGPSLNNGPGDWASVGLVQSWIDSRPTPLSPTTNDIPSPTDPISNLFDFGDVNDDIVTRYDQENDQHPYDEDVVFGNADTSVTEGCNLMRASVAVPSPSAPVAPIHGFDALCGLVELTVGTGNGANQWELVIDVESKGVAF